MRKIRLICVGKNQKGYISDGVRKFEKKIRRYCKLELTYVRDTAYHSESTEHCIKKEGEALIKHLSSDHLTIVCDEKGETVSSTELSKIFTNWANRGYSRFDFVIGGAYGLSREVKAAANILLSLSRMTITHQLIRLMLLEQIYRVFTIINGEKYHHS